MWRDSCVFNYPGLRPGEFVYNVYSGYADSSVPGLVVSKLEGMMDKKTLKKIPVEVYSRIVGYFRPVQHWNKGKKEEFKDRKEFSLGGVMEKLREKFLR